MKTTLRVNTPVSMAILLTNTQTPSPVIKTELEYNDNPWVYSTTRKILAMSGLGFQNVKVFQDSLGRWSLEFVANNLTFTGLDYLADNFCTKNIDFGADPDRSISSENLKVEIKNIRFLLK